METYISKVTSMGQITVPRGIRKKLGIDENSYVEFDSIGNAVILRKLGADKNAIEKIRKKIKKSGVTKDKVLRILEEEGAKIWRKEYAKNIP